MTLNIWWILLGMVLWTILGFLVEIIVVAVMMYAKHKQGYNVLYVAADNIRRVDTEAEASADSNPNECGWLLNIIAYSAACIGYACIVIYKYLLWPISMITWIFPEFKRDILSKCEKYQDSEQDNA